MQKYRAKLQRYTIILTVITLIVSVIFMLYLPRLEKLLAKRRKQKKAADKKRP